jgi:hypothetical protein
MRLMSIVFILSLFGACLAAGWVEGYTDSRGHYHQGHYDSDYSSTSSSSSNNYSKTTYETKKYKTDDDDSYKPKTEYVKPYVKKMVLL